MPRLTKRLIDAATVGPQGAEKFIWDVEVRGFGVRVKPTGAKSFVLKYRIGTKTRRWTISKVGSPYTIEEARKVASDALREIRAGHDPMEKKAAGREALTIGQLADLYLLDGPAEKANKKISSWGADRSNIDRHIRPLLGRRLAKSLTKAGVERFQADVAAGKSAADIKTGKRGRAIIKGGKGTAARSLAVLGAMLQFGVGRGILTANPAKGVKLFHGEKMERFLSEVEVARLADTLAMMEGEGLNKNAATAVRLLLLTGCRRDEILSLQWEHVDIERKCLRLPDSKTGAKVVPLAAAALSLLADLPKQGHGQWVLPAKRDAKSKPKADLGHYTGLQKAWEKIRDRASVAALAEESNTAAVGLIARLTEGDKLPTYSKCVEEAAGEGWAFPTGLSNLRLHDLRHSFASFAIADGATLFMVGKVLGHKQARTTEGYAHLAADPVRAVADRAANRIAEAMKPRGAGDKKANVVDMPVTGGRK